MAVSVMTPISMRKLRSHDYVFIYCFLGWKIVELDKKLSTISTILYQSYLSLVGGRNSSFQKVVQFWEILFCSMCVSYFFHVDRHWCEHRRQSGIRASTVTNMQLPDSLTFPNYLQAYIPLWYFKFFINRSDITPVIAGDTTCTSVTEVNSNSVVVTAIGITNHSNTVLLSLRLRPEVNLS